MGLTPIIPNVDDLKRTMGTLPPTLGRPDAGPPQDGSLPSLGGLPPLSQAPSIQTAPPMPGLRPLVTNPRQQQEQNLQSKISAFESPSKPQGFWANLRHVIAQNPYSIAYKNAQHEQQVNELSTLNQQDLQEREAVPKSNLENAQAGYYQQHGSQVGVRPMTAEEATAIGHPELEGSMMDQKSISTLLGKRDTNQTRSDISDASNQTKLDLAKIKPEQRDDRAIRLNEKQQMGQPLSQEESAYLQSYAKWIQDTKIAPGVARAAAFGQFRPVQVIDDAGNVHYDSAAHAIGTGASSPQSMNFRTATAMSKFMTSGKGGQTITAYNTANDHLELLGKAAEALQNGDTQALNQLSNAFKQQFGQNAPTNFNAVKAMLAGELANVAKVTGATDQEIQEQKDNINRAASPDQIKGFIDTNHDLMDQKAYELFQQYQQGEQGKPAFNTGFTGTGPANKPTEGGTALKAGDVRPGADGDYRFKGGDQYDKKNWEKVKK